MNLLRRKLPTIAAQLPYVPRALLLVWDASRTLTLVWFGLIVLLGLLPVASVYLTRALVNTLVAVVGRGAGWTEFSPVLILVVLMALVLIVTELATSASTAIRALQADRVRDHISGLVHAQAARLDLAYYENADYFDQLHRARIDANTRPLTLLENLGGVLQNSLTLVAMILVLIPFGWWLPLMLTISTLPALYVVLRFALKQHEWRLRTTPDERLANYFDWLLTARETAAELRLFEIARHFQERFLRLRERLRQEKWGMAKEQAFSEFVAGLIGLLALGGALAFMLWQALAGNVNLGDLALLYAAFTTGQRLMRSLLENIGQIFSNSLFLSNLFEFLELEPQVVAPPAPHAIPHPLERGIDFRQVFFRYPGSERYALENFNLTIPAGQTIAIVGMNGAGKSTLIKLLCRFYDPEQGSIALDGVDLRELAPEDLRQRITVLFQEPTHYNATVSENIAYGDFSYEVETASAAVVSQDNGSSRNARVREAAVQAGADEIIRRLPGGYEARLGRWLAGGTELSVGEWQRIALARAFVRRAPLIILDEPTSAMDSWAEADWLERFKTLAMGRTALIITHRFTTAMRADQIHVMEEGRVVESGRHQDLLAAGGLYAQSWHAQIVNFPAPLETTALEQFHVTQ